MVKPPSKTLETALQQLNTVVIFDVKKRRTPITQEKLGEIIHLTFSKRR